MTFEFREGDAYVVNYVLNGEGRMTTEMALRLSKALGASAESWLRMQEAYDLWHARQAVNLDVQ
ncbi:MAG: HigA family addiction module antidote protein [Microbacteriaceae bacterium]|nr:HigA family addiction module antidote protein [Microbacteriaceae bacterium]